MSILIGRKNDFSSDNRVEVVCLKVWSGAEEFSEDSDIADDDDEGAGSCLLNIVEDVSVE